MGRPAKNPFTPPWPFEAYALIVGPCPGRPGDFQVILPDFPEFWVSGHSQADAIANAKANFPGHVRRYAYASRTVTPPPEPADDLANAKTSVPGHVRTAARAIPPPEFAPAVPHVSDLLNRRLWSASGKFVIRMGVTLHSELRQRAAVDRVPMNVLVTHLLAASIQPSIQPPPAPKPRKHRPVRRRTITTKQFLARIPPSLHGALRSLASEQGISLNLWVTTALAAQLAMRTPAHKPVAAGAWHHAARE